MKSYFLCRRLICEAMGEQAIAVRVSDDSCLSEISSYIDPLSVSICDNKYP